METVFKNKVALITGGTSGIGKATAIAFAKRGAKVVIVDKNEDSETLSTIKKIADKMLFIRCDVSNSTEVKLMIEKTIATFGRLDYAFNNAGIEGRIAITADCSEENWDNTLNINLKGIWLCMKYEIHEMLKHRKGVIINCSSVAGLVGFNGSPAYVASK
ncbi:MAG: SDR family NAD(P)-dependent oxidoreductase, partial [Aquirufa sp.]